MSQNRIPYDVSKPSWLTAMKINTIRLALLAVFASGPAFARPMMGSEDSYGCCEKKNGRLSCSGIKSIRGDRPSAFPLSESDQG